MPRDIPIASKTLALPTVARLKKNRRWDLLRLLSFTDKRGRLKEPEDTIAWRIGVRVETLVGIRDALVKGRLLTIIDGVYQFSERFFACPDFYLSETAVRDPAFGRLTKSERFTVVQLMALSDEHGCVNLSDEDIAYNQHTRLEWWLPRAARVMQYGAMKRTEDQYFMADLLYADCDAPDEEDYPNDTGEDEEEPPALSYGALRPRYPSDTREARRERKQLERLRKKAEAEGVTSPSPADVTSRNGSDVTSPSHERAPIDSNRFESIDIAKAINRFESIEEDTPPPDVTSASSLSPPEVLPADVVQMLMEKSPDKDGNGAIGLERAEFLLKTYGAQACLERILTIAANHPDRPGGFIEKRLAKPAAYPVPAKIIAQAKSLLSPRVPKPPPNPPGRTPVQEAKERLTDDERKLLLAEAVPRMPKMAQERYQKAIQEGHELSELVKSALAFSEDAVLAEWIDQARKAVGE